MHPIYLDHNSTTPMRVEVAQAMLDIDHSCFGNPSSAHALGRAARRRLEEAREGIAARLGADPSEIIFTSGATEANNLALFGLLHEPGEILSSQLEHPCVLEPLNQLGQNGYTIRWLPVTARGIVETATVRAHLSDVTRLITLMLVNHETGAIQPVRHVAKTRPKSVLLHCDAAQAVGKIPIDFHDLGVSSLTISGHKFGGPRGIGALLLKTGLKLKPQLFGGHQQRGFRPGTEPLAQIVGLHRALELCCQDLAARRQRLQQLRTLLWDELARHAQPVTVNGPELTSPESLPSTLNVSFPGCRADLLLVSLDLAGVACSTGSACSSGSLLPSPVLQAMGVPDEVLRSAIRLSISTDCTEPEMLEAANRIIRAVQNARQPRQGSY